MSVVTVTDASFDADVLKSESLVLVDFWAEWCGPCRLLGPVLETLASDMSSTLKVCKVNIDDNPESPTTYGVRSIPTLCLFKNGKPIATEVGALSKTALVEWIEKHQTA